MKTILQDQIQTVVTKLYGHIPNIESVKFQVTASKNKEHGDFATNVALVLAKKAKQAPMEIANALQGHLGDINHVTKLVVAAPGFINFFVDDATTTNVVSQVLTMQSNYGAQQHKQQGYVHLEFVSVNPTGPLHVGHGRNAVYGSALANCLEAAGYQVHREYYVNDAGRQMDILAVSVWMRYLELLGEIIKFPASGYAGNYVFDIAEQLIAKYQRIYYHKASSVLSKLPLDVKEGGDQEQYIDALVTRCKLMLGDDNYRDLHAFALEQVSIDIKRDLTAFGVEQVWFSEQSLLDQNSVEDVLDVLKRKECVYEKDHAIWFAASKYGDEKDRVLVRANGQYTYFATDIANHYHKYLKDYTDIIDVWGADHHGYIPRMRAAITALGLDVSKYRVLLVQFATLFRGDERVQMSTRSGTFIKLRDLQEEIGVDAARFFYVMRKSEQHMDFDIELAKSQTNDNPVYYIQYAHARICSVLEQANHKKLAYEQELGLQNLHLLSKEHEIDLMKHLAKYPETIQLAAKNYAPHLIAQYLKELANYLHSYYNAEVFLLDDTNLRNARLCLCIATRQVLANGLRILGVTAPEKM